MSKQKVSIVSDVALGVRPVCVSLHLYVPTTPPPAPPTPAPVFELPINMAWPPGGVTHRFTSSVFHLGFPIALAGHDCGMLILHVAIMPIRNLLDPIHMAFSSRKMVFSASTVRMNGSETGVSDLLAIPTPMMVCQEPVSLPVAFPLTNALNTVCVGATLGDLLAGYAAIAISIAADLLLYALSSAGNPMKQTFEEFAKRFINKMFNLRSWSVKTAAGILTGLIKIALTGNGSVEIKIGPSFAQAKIGVEVKDGKVIGKAAIVYFPVEIKGEVSRDKVKVSGTVHTGLGDGPKVEVENAKVKWTPPNLNRVKRQETTLVKDKKTADAIVGGEEPL